MLHGQADSTDSHTAADANINCGGYLVNIELLGVLVLADLFDGDAMCGLEVEGVGFELLGGAA